MDKTDVKLKQIRLYHFKERFAMQRQFWVKKGYLLIGSPRKNELTEKLHNGGFD